MAEIPDFPTPPKETVSMETTEQVQQQQKKPQQEIRVPISKSFSFSLSELWAPKKNSLLQWVNGLPEPVTRDEPLEPAHFQPLKHQIDIDSSDASYSMDDHRDKRMKVSSAMEHHPAVESRRQRLIASGRGLARRVSNVYQRIITPIRYQDAFDGSTIRGSTVRGSDSLPGTPTTLPGPPKMRFVFVGDSGSGKSAMLLRYYRDTFSLQYTRTQYELFSKTAVVDDQEVDLELWDTCGDVKLHQLQLLSYLAWDAVFLCFSVNSMKRFNNAKTKWIKEIRMHCRDAPIIFVGMKKDLRVGSGLWAPLLPRLETRVGATEANMAANGMGAVKYMECSAETGEGVDAIFEEGVRVVFDERAADEEAARMRERHMKAQGGGLGQLLCFQ